MISNSYNEAWNNLLAADAKWDYVLATDYMKVSFESFKTAHAILKATFTGENAYLADRVSDITEESEDTNYYLVTYNKVVVGAFAVNTKTKYISAVVKDNTSKDFHGSTILKFAKKVGGTWLDCYGKLEGFYNKCGFKACYRGENLDNKELHGEYYLIMALEADAAKINGGVESNDYCLIENEAIAFYA